MTYLGRGVKGKVEEGKRQNNTSPLFVTTSPKYAFMNDVMGIGIGASYQQDGKARVQYDVYDLTHKWSKL